MNNNLEYSIPSLLRSLGQAALPLQQDSGSFPAGWNGPYLDPETPVRNTSHWLITLSWLASRENEVVFRDAAYATVRYLSAKEARPFGFTFHHRNKPGKDRCNGLIGQAWTIEALAEASRSLNQPEWAELAAEAFLLHPFRAELGLWERIEVDGKNLGFDGTFNHQLWFAAAGALTAKAGAVPEVQEQVKTFVDRLPELLTVLPGGTIKHKIAVLEAAGPRIGSLAYVRRLARRARKAAEMLSTGGLRAHKGPTFSRQERRVGYQAFNLYALALLKDHFPDHEAWETEAVRNAISFAMTDEYRQGLEDNIFGYGYNAPGFEVPVALSKLSSLPQSEVLARSSWWVNEQFRRCMDWHEMKMSKCTADPETLTARIYELLRVPRELLEQIKVETVYDEP